MFYLPHDSCIHAEDIVSAALEFATGCCVMLCDTVCPARFMGP